MSDIPETLPFNIEPKFLEDLGVNLYTSLEKVLVEFVANAYDADATQVRISLDADAIEDARKKLRKGLGGTNSTNAHTLPENISITIEDDGTGMTKEDLRNKFLQVSRRKRDIEGTRSPKLGRAFMGRKGLGKLAGFGVAHKIVVTSRREGEAHATRITLDYSRMRVCRSMAEVQVPCETLDCGGGFAKGRGTRVELSNLVLSGLRARQEIALQKMVDDFWMVGVDDFAIFHGGTQRLPTKRQFIFAYPALKPENLDDLASVSVALAGQQYSLRYRIRFTGSKQQLSSGEYGVRVYAHGRLASMPSLFDVKSSSTGHRYTPYMDGVLVADFIDDQNVDYIATSRQALRWDTEIMDALFNFTQQEIKTALKSRFDSDPRLHSLLRV